MIARSHGQSLGSILFGWDKSVVMWPLRQENGASFCCSLDRENEAEQYYIHCFHVPSLHLMGLVWLITMFGIESFLRLRENPTASALLTIPTNDATYETPATQLTKFLTFGRQLSPSVTHVAGLNNIPHLTRQMHHIRI